MKDPRYPFALAQGTEIGGYLIDRVLGAGGFGITYRGYNEVTRKQVAIKEFYIREISSRDGTTVVVDQDVESGTYEYALKKFQDEAQSVVTRFQHPYIIRGENFLRAHNTCYLIMEYIEGSNLDDWLNARQSPPSESEIRPFFEKLFDAVDYVHEHNMMHRDLTPRNIMMRLNGDPVLIDFGAAGLGIDLGRFSKIVAQLRYAPPEQSDETGSGVHGRYTDVFSLAGVLFRTVTGKTPTAPTSRLARMSGDGARDPQAPVATLVANPADYSPAFLAGIDQGLSLNERLRPQSISEFRRALGWSDGAVSAASAREGADAVTEIITPVTRPPASTVPSLPDTDATRALPRAPASVVIDDATRLVAPATVSSPSETLPIEQDEVAQPLPRRALRWLVFAALAVSLLLGAGGLGFRDQIGAWIASLTQPALVSPYRFTARFDGKALNLSGFIPDEATHQAFIAAVGTSAPEVAINDHLKLGRGAPGGLLLRFTAFARHLPEMARGQLDVRGDAATVNVVAATPRAYATLAADVALLNQDAGGAVTLVPASVTPYVFTLTTIASPTTPSATLTGYLPDLATRLAISNALTAAIPGIRINDETQTALGNAFDIGAVVAALSPRLAELDHATLSVAGKGMTLQGTPRDPADLDKVSVPIDPASIPGRVPVTLAIAPLKVSPYTLQATIAEGVLTLSGFIPDAALRAQVASLRAPDTKLVDHMQIADGAPGNASEAILFAASLARQFETGSIALKDQTIAVSGIVRRVADIAQVKDALDKHAPRGFTVVNARYGLRSDVPTQDCDRLALPPDHQDRPSDVIGVAYQGINAALAVPACRQAVEVFPNVRRFETALGAALQREGNYADAITHYRLAIDADDATAMAMLGIMLNAGQGQSADPKQAATLIEKARALDNGTALFAIGQSYERAEFGHATDVQEAEKWYVRATNHASADAYARLGQLAQSGVLHGSPDVAQAMAYYAKAAELGLPSAMLRLGQLYQQGLTPTHVKDLTKAFDWYSRAAASGTPDAMVALANLYLSGQGTAPDPTKARIWLGKAADAGDVNAMQLLGRLEFDGIGDTRNVQNAIAWFEKAASKGRADSYGKLGALFAAHRSNGIEPDYVSAFAFDEKGVALNDPHSYLQLGLLHEGGLGRPVDDAKAEENFQKAADLGLAAGYFQLGLMAERGRGRPVDYARAAAQYKRAADLSFAPAMVKLGILAENGRGLPRDDAVALLNYTKALQLGDTLAMWYAAVLTDVGRGGAKNPDRVAEYLLDAFRRKEPHAVAALSGDMAAFSVESRIALQRKLQARGLLKDTALDGTFDAVTRDAVTASARDGSE